MRKLCMTFAMLFAAFVVLSCIVIPAPSNSSTSPTGVKLDKSDASLEVGESVTLTATITPGNAKNKNVTWTSSNENVVVEADGLTAKITVTENAKAGEEATITVKTEEGGFTAKCQITIKEKEEPTPALKVLNSYFWGKWTRMDNGVEYEITETTIKTSTGKEVEVSSSSDDSFTCSLGTFKKESDSIMRIDKIPVFRNGGSNIEYKVSIVGFADNSSRAATATTSALKGQKVKNKTETYPSYSEENSSDENGIVTLHSPVSGTQNTLQITASDGSVVTAIVAPKNAGENVGTIPVVPKGMYSLKVLGEVTNNEEEYLYAGNTYQMNVKIQNISEVEAETSIVTMESESPYLSISGTTITNISTFPGGQSKTLELGFSAQGFDAPFIDTAIRVTFEDTSLAQNVWVDRIPLRIFKGKEQIIVKAVSTENNASCALNGFVMYPDGNSQYFTIPHNEKKTIEVPSFPATMPYMLSFCGATTGAELSDSTEMKYSIGVNVEPPDISGIFSVKEIISYEPNDTEADAKSLGISSKIKTYLKKGDIDYYKIIANSYGVEDTDYNVFVKADVSITDDKFLADADKISISVTEAEDTVVFTGNEGFEKYKWSIDGEALESTSNTVEIPLSEISAGYHRITVEATDSDEKRFFASKEWGKID